jgi:hypothetical protein
MTIYTKNGSTSTLVRGLTEAGYTQAYPRIALTQPLTAPKKININA